jgi:hypothetical protein
MIDSFHQYGDTVAGFLGEAKGGARLGSDASDHSRKFQGERAFLLWLGQATSSEKMPELLGEAAGDSSHCNVAVSFS